MTDGSSPADPVGQLAEEFMARHRRGERPALSEYTDRYPDLAERIRDVFPLMIVMEEAGSSADATGPGSAKVSDREGGLPARIAGYRILREVGRGGMGVVYEAEQLALGRRVALKVLPEPIARDPLGLERFRREARAAARLHHTNIVPVYEVGQDGGVVFYAMQFIRGQPLDLVLDELKALRRRRDASRGPDVAEADGAAAEAARSLLTGRFETGPAADPGQTPEVAATISMPLASASTSASSSSSVLPGQSEQTTNKARRRHYERSVAQVGVQVAEALAYAHREGVVHRDIKPSNLLLDTESRIWITDFGLAKTEGDGLTRTGDIIGTLRYMAPERFHGWSDPRSDVYSLGLTLYELLLSQPAFDTTDRVELIRRITHEDPVRPCKVDPRIPRDLETIILKAIDKEPARRYPTAAELSADLRRFLNYEPIQARSVGPVERAWIWARRRPAIATLLVLVALSCATGLAAALGLWRRAEDQRNQAVVARNEAVEARKMAENQRVEAQRRAARLAFERGVSLCHQGEIGHGMLWLARTLELAPPGEDDLVRVARTNLASWRRRLTPLREVFSVNNVTTAIFSPDGRLILTGSGAPEGKGGEARLWDAATFRPVGPPLIHPNPIYAMFFSPDGRAFLTIAGGRLQVWDTATQSARGDSIVIPLGHRASFSPPDGKLISCPDPTDLKAFRLYDATTGKPFGPPLRHRAATRLVKYSPDGAILCTTTQDGSVQLWDTRTGAPLGPPLWEGKALVRAMAFRPDSKALLLYSESIPGGIGETQIWDIESRKRIGPAVQPHGEAGIRDMAWSRDGQRVLTGGWDRAARLWDPTTGKLLVEPLRHEDIVTSVAFSPDGSLIRTGSQDGALRLWDSATGRPVGSAIRHGGEPKWSRFSPDGGTILSLDSENVLRFWTRPSDQPVGSPLVHASGSAVAVAVAVEISADGRVVLTTTVPLDPSDPEKPPGEAKLWDAATRQPLGLPRSCQRANLSPDGKLLATLGKAGDAFGDAKELQLWDVDTGQPRGAPIRTGGFLFGTRFSPDGKTFVTYGGAQSHVLAPECEVRLWETASGRPLGVLGKARLAEFELLFRPDGSWVLGESTARDLLFWDVATLRPIDRSIRPKSWTWGKAFSPDSQTLVAGGSDGVVRTWELATGRLLDEIPRFQDLAVVEVAFSPDGQTFLACSVDNIAVNRRRAGDIVRRRLGAALLYDAASRLPLGAPIDQGGTCSAVFSPDGTMVITGGLDGQVRFWSRPNPVVDDLERISLWVQVSTGLRLTSDDKIQTLDVESWQARRRRLDELGGPSKP